ncbi:MFS transporter [Plantactinospora sonchi]|uniref:MFS transporter n=1 Tax=Plantactinospora sonchi TaxID=1544735 RepID=A0ABU7RLJ4_9ACTN
MSVTSSPTAPESRARRLAVTYHLYVFLDDFVLLYPVYALLFTDTGLSVAEISSLFVLWALSGLLLEVPSGVVADAVSRRLLLGAAPLFGALGFALWVAAPSYGAFAVGFLLWGVRGALQSGAAEALLYDELDRLGLAGRYGRLIGRATTTGLVAVLLATAVAAPVFAAGGYPAVGAASVLASLLCAVAGFALPEHRSTAAPAPVATAGAGTTGPAPGVGGGGVHRGDPTREGDPPDEVAEPSGWLAVLRAGLTEARTNPPVRRALLLLAVISGIWGGLEEYTSLLAGEVVAAPTVPLLVLLVWAGVMLGGLLTPVGQRLGRGWFAATVALAAGALAVGALSGRPSGFVLIALAYCALQMVGLVLDVRLQESISGPSRATVTSLAGLGTELITITLYGGYAFASGFAGHGGVVALCAVPYLVVAMVLVRVPGSGRSEPASRVASRAARTE